MRIRRLSALFWSTCIIAFVFILYVVMDLSFKLPSIKPAIQDLDDTKWSSFEHKLRHIENELNQHHAVVGEIKSAVEKIVDKSEEFHTQKRPKITKVFTKDEVKSSTHDSSKQRVFKVVDEPTKPKFQLNMSSCPIQKEVIPKTDIQMLSVYERITFDDIDGGVWKQGWNIEYKQDQWSKKNKLKVFIVPHSHNDPGWLKTFENYYKTQTRAIFNNMVEKLVENPGRKFIWAETSYLALWWENDATDKDKATFQTLLKSGQLEIVTGGWVMNDEANSHWVGVAQQLTAGHQWLARVLHYSPRSAWAIDPFGHSAAQPYLLRLAGLRRSVVQRVHYRLKKELALSRQLEFKWRQLWDGTGKTELFTHMMPFYSYDVPHTCGPDPKICCQFDFKRLPGNGVTCPWGLPPRKITQKNVHERSSLILDQWRKKAQLYRSNVVLVPLGDDFRYDRANEWDNQYQNYEMIIEYINSNQEWNAEVQFGTLSDYFQALQAEVKPSEFPVLSGDMFTYADRGQHYWSGYYTSRPFYKSMDRALLAYLRAAEIITAQAVTSKSITSLLSIQLRDRVDAARRSLALFQHHDGITGTSRNEVREDYAKKLLAAIKHCQSVLQQAAYFLLKQPDIPQQAQEDIFFDMDDIWRQHDEVPSRSTIMLDVLWPARRLVLYNALAFRRTEIVTVLVSSPHVEVSDAAGEPVHAQVSPAVSGERRLGFAASKFQLSFLVTVEPLALAVYTISLRDSAAINKYTSFARVRVYNADYWTIDLPKIFAVEQPTERLAEDVTLQTGNSTRLVATRLGLLKAVVYGGTTTPVHMDYVKYDSMVAPDNNSGAYLFIPGGLAVPLDIDAFPELVLIEGPFKASLYTALVAPKQAEIVLTMSVNNNPSRSHAELEISNTFLIDPQVDDLELAMRFSTEIANGDVFYTDVNGMQMIKRRYFEKLPLQANFYPLPAAAYIEDGATRLTLLTSAPLGVAALQPGQIEVMQDRRLSRDDNRGLNQGVFDNVRTRHTFRVLLESARPACERKVPPEHPSGQLSLGAHVAQQKLLQPLVAMHYAGRVADRPPTYSRASANAADIVLASFNAHVSAMDKDNKLMDGMGITFQRVYLDTCYGSSDTAKWYPISDGQVDLTTLFDTPTDRIYESTLTFARFGAQLPSASLALCPMEIRSLFINYTMKHG